MALGAQAREIREFREEYKEQLNVLMQDIRHAFRVFSRTPFVTATALLTIALGVGGSTATIRSPIPPWV